MDASAPVEVYCDMETKGGGWTLIARSFEKIGAAAYPWSDILSQNYFGNQSISITLQVPPQYWADYKFFALLNATQDMEFTEVLLEDGLQSMIQSMADPKTMRMIHDGIGVEPLYQSGINTGVMLLLGNSDHHPTFPCYYPKINGQSCYSWNPGDDGAHSTAFYVGDLNACASGPAPGNLPKALWGSQDCYATDSSGGFGGFTYHRYANAGKGWVNRAYGNNPWKIYYR